MEHLLFFFASFFLLLIIVVVHLLRAFDRTDHSHTHCFVCFVKLINERKTHSLLQIPFAELSSTLANTLLSSVCVLCAMAVGVFLFTVY